jgi:small subunit ribosomal protein S16
MLRIRLRKPGKTAKGRYPFKIVVIEGTRARDSRYIEQVGTYDPTQDALKFEVSLYESWVKKGAKPTDTVMSLFKRYRKQIAKTQ